VEAQPRRIAGRPGSAATAATMPLAVAVDAAIVPPLLLLAPIVMVIGD
jgi:hypothetical protein